MQQAPNHRVHADKNFDVVRTVVAGEKHDGGNKQLCCAAGYDDRRETVKKSHFLVYLYSDGDTFSLFGCRTPAH